MLDATVGADDGDPSTAVSAGHVPSSYVSSLRADALKGARVGILKNLFGDTPDDREVSEIDRHALDEMRAAGAEVEEVAIPGSTRSSMARR